MAKIEKKSAEDKEIKSKAADVIESEEKKDESKTAKAGKRSAKAIKEKEAEQAKENRRISKETDTDSKNASKPPRSRLERSGKRLRAAAEHVDRNKAYPLLEAVEILPKTSTVKFDATVELHVNLGVDPKQADQNIRDSLVLPAGSGRQVRVAVYVEGDDAVKAKKAGADIAGIEELQTLLEKEQINFDVLISTPQMMQRLSKYARFLGPRGLMPNPKSGTVTADVAKAVSEAKAGRVEYRVDSSGIIHLAIGKISFSKDQLVQNAQAALESIKGSRPPSLKGSYIKSIFLTTAMGPSIKVENS